MKTNDIQEQPPGTRIKHRRPRDARDFPYDVLKRQECKPCPFCKVEMVKQDSCCGIGVVWSHPAHNAVCWFDNITGSNGLIEGGERLELWNKRGI